MEKDGRRGGGKDAYPTIPEEERERIRALRKRKDAESRIRRYGNEEGLPPGVNGAPRPERPEGRERDRGAWDRENMISSALAYTSPPPGGMEFRFSEDWTDYEAVMREHPDLFSHDAERDEWSLTAKGKKAKGDLSKGEFNAYVTLSSYRRYKKFPEDRVGGDRWLPDEEIAARGWRLI